MGHSINAHAFQLQYDAFHGCLQNFRISVLRKVSLIDRRRIQPVTVTWPSPACSSFALFSTSLANPAYLEPLNTCGRVIDTLLAPSTVEDIPNARYGQAGLGNISSEYNQTRSRWRNIEHSELFFCG